MVNGKKKGKNGELEVVRLCRAQGYEARRSAQYCGNNEEGAADVVGLPGIHIEVKRVDTPDKLTRKGERKWKENRD